jgi:L-threonylcarbamoyladenylate synthase
MLELHVDQADAAARTAAALLDGAIGVVPTDTVYGLAAVPHDADAVRRIFVAKDRPAQTNLPVMASSLDQVAQLGVTLSEEAMSLAARWWPGPLTLVFGFSPTTPRPDWLDGRDEVAVRVPDHRFLLDLMADTGVLLVTSANRHGQPTAPSAAQAAAELAPHIGVVVDGGRLTATPSTLVNLAVVPPVVERAGAISAAEIATALGSVA